MEISPRYHSFFRRHGLTDVAAFLDLPGETPHIVSGHPDRHVVRISFGSGRRRWIAFLKREHRVGWRVRLGNALAGFGFLSRSLREARMLQALERESVRGPEWLAAGEDRCGRAFLLVREIKGVELRSFLRREKDAARRRRIARNLGIALARMHNAGYLHPDLYANHCFIEADGSIRILDWQRARLKHAVSAKERRRDLASLHATVDDVLAAPRERLICLHAYRRADSSCGAAWRAAVQGIEMQARRLLTRRHIREKRQPPAQRQAWICLDGDALCITPAMQGRCKGRIPSWLRSQANPLSRARRWPMLAGGNRALLVQRCEKKWFSDLWDRLRRHSQTTPEQRQAALLLRLQRHSIPAPQVLALGQRRGVGSALESVLLTEPLAETCSLEAWLACQLRRRITARGQARRWSVLRQAGALLQRLHEASCYLHLGPSGCGLAVRRTEGKVTVVLEDAESVIPCRRWRPGRAARDVRRLQQILHSLSCSRTDICRFRAGYYRNAGRNPKRSVSTKRALLRVAAKQNNGTGTRSIWRRLFQGARRICHRPDWPRFVGSDWAERIMDARVTDRFVAKQGRSTGRWILHAREKQRLSVYLKRHYQLPWWRRWLATLWPHGNWSPAMRERHNLHWAQQQGVPTPEVVAAAEYVGPWGRLRSFLAVEELADMISLQDAIPLAGLRQDAAAFRQWKRTLAAEMARLARILHDRRCFHKDLYLCHFYIARGDTRTVPADGWRGRVHLIDLHRLAHHPRTRRIWQAKDLAQLLYSSEIIGLNARDRLYFWRAYRGPGERHRRPRWLRRFILFKWKRYRHHNARHRQPRKTGQEPNALMEK